MAFNSIRNIITFKQDTQPTSPSDGDIWYHRTLQQLFVYGNGKWFNFYMNYTVDIDEDSGVEDGTDNGTGDEEQITLTGDVAIFAGGIIPDPNCTTCLLVSKIIDYTNFTSNTTATAFGSLFNSQGLDAPSACSNGINGRMLIAGGNKDILQYSSLQQTDTIQTLIITNLGNAASFKTLSTKRSYMMSVSNGTNNKALFAGGYEYSSKPWLAVSTLNIVTISSDASADTISNLGVKIAGGGGVSNGTSNMACFVAGSSSGISDIPSFIQFFNISTLANAGYWTSNSDPQQQHTRYLHYVNVAAADNRSGNVGMYGCGWTGTSWQASIFKLSSISNTRSEAARFGTLSYPANPNGSEGLMSKPVGVGSGLNNIGLFAGQTQSGNPTWSRINYLSFTNESDRDDFGNLSSSRTSMCAASNC